MFRVAKHLMKAFASEAIEVSESNGIRALHMGSVTVQSAMQIRDPNALELTYTRGMMCFLLFNSHIEQVLAIGLGGGSIPKYIHAHCLEISTTVIEISPKIIQVARSQFYVPDNDERLQIVEGDGLQYLADHTSATDVLLIDAFDSNGIPPDFCSQDFFDQCAETLKSDGILAINLWGSDKNFDVYLQRIEQSFASKVLILPTGKPGNIVVFGFNREPADLRIGRLRDRAKQLEKNHKIEFLQFVEKLVEYNEGTSNRIFMSSDKKTNNK